MTHLKFCPSQMNLIRVLQGKSKEPTYDLEIAFEVSYCITGETSMEGHT
jgi:hypothetical protein